MNIFLCRNMFIYFDNNINLHTKTYLTKIKLNLYRYKLNTNYKFRLYRCLWTLYFLGFMLREIINVTFETLFKIKLFFFFTFSVCYIQKIDWSVLVCREIGDGSWDSWFMTLQDQVQPYTELLIVMSEL